MLLAFNKISPSLGHDVFIAPDSWVIGDVRLNDNVSVFFGAVLRGDILPIEIGARTNIQEHSVLHTSHGRTPTIVAEQVTIGHRAIVHGCSIGPRTLIGMGAIILDEAEIGEECIIGAGALVPVGVKIPPRSLVLGIPGKIIRSVTEEEVIQSVKNTESYVNTGKIYLSSDLDVTRK